MPLVSSPLLRDWDLLQQHVIPHLLEVGQADEVPRSWSLGSVADAVAVVAAYQHARPGGAVDLQAYASESGRELSPVTFALSDVRCVPAGTRSASFERRDDAWIPGHQIAEQILLSHPSEPLDLVTMPAGQRDDAATRAIDQLRDGGHLLLLEPDRDLGRVGNLKALGASGRLFRKCAHRRAAEARRRRVERNRAGGDATLARHQAQADLVSSHARLARSLARRFSHRGESKDDLEQVALLALVKAARRFDPGRDISFSTYATASILGEIKRHFRDKTWMMRVPRSVQESYLAVKEAREALTHELSASPTVAQIADRLGTSDEAVLEAMEAGDNYWPESLDAGVFDGESGREVPVSDGAFDLALDRQELTTLLPRLAVRERLILKRVFLDGWTQRQVAEEIGVSQMQVSRLLSRTVDKLRAWIDEP